jgi:hypothetical protein
VKKTLTRKFIYVLAAIAILAMLIPAMAVPANAQTASLTMKLVDPVSGLAVADGAADGNYNIAGSVVQITLNGVTALDWGLRDIAVNPVTNGASFVYPTIPTHPMGVNTVYVQGDWGDTIITAYYATGNISIEKKWGKISSTDITASGSTAVTWNEAVKTWTANASITDNVTGTFYQELNPAFLHAAQGTILNWYLVRGSVAVSLAAGDADVLKPRMAGLLVPTHVVFGNISSTGNTTSIRTVTGPDGRSTVTLNATGEEGVQIVVVPEYPFNSPTVNIPIVPEITTWNFYTTESEVVPQVRWAGEKIVLEKYWGPSVVSANGSYSGFWVKYSLQNQSVGALEGINGTLNIVNGSTVWTKVRDGGSSVILTSSDTGTSNVAAGLYNYAGADPNAYAGTLINQHYFTVFWLKFEKLTLGDVNGKRLGHNTGLWDPPNPYLTTTDNTTQTLNVSQDALLRARVSGWFTSTNPSNRPARVMDVTNSPSDTTSVTGLTLPQGRWILPDDWAALAGPNWLQSRIHWDIMNTPDGTSGSYSGWSDFNIATNFIGTAAGAYNYALNNTGVPPPTNGLNAINDPGNQFGIGNYYKIKANTQNVPPYLTPPSTGIKILYSNAANPQIAMGPNGLLPLGVTGPFSPGLELMMPNGWQLANPNYDPLFRNMDTTVPDGALNQWDAPMPPAKIIFQIQGSTDAAAKAGFFKPAAKTDIYYIWLPDPANSSNANLKVYTNPFYQELIPAHEAIPAFINNGGYDWNSFDSSYGPYMFWQFINQNRFLPIVTSSDPSGHPTVVEVYSDNHGEAMVWLNGNWNLNLQNPKGAADIPYMTQVGTSTVQATADYPYSRYHQAIQSNMDTKTLQWGGIVLGTDLHTFPNGNVSNGQATRLVLSAGSYDKTSVTGSFPNQSALSLDHVVWVFVSDRDGRLDGVNGAQVNWDISQFSGSGGYFRATNGYLSDYNWVTRNVTLTGGFLTGTNGTIFDSLTTKSHAVSYLIPVKSSIYLTALFNKFWGSGTTENGTSYPATSTISGLNPANFAVAAIDVQAGGSAYQDNVTVNISIHSPDFLLNPPLSDPTLLYQTLVDFSAKDSLDDSIRAGDANCDGAVNMGDVTATERMILGLDKVTSNAVLNTDGTVDMGTVVKIERSILGLK